LHDEFHFDPLHQVSTKRVKASSNSGRKKKEEWEKRKIWKQFICKKILAKFGYRPDMKAGKF
jgi:ribosomal protein L37AE/L43A